MAHTDLTIVIAYKNRQDNVKYCIDSILTCDGNLKLIVVDFGSDIPLASILPAHANLQIIRVQRSTEIFHKARALNIGIRKVNTPFTCISDADQIFAPDFFCCVAKLLGSQAKMFVQSKTYFLQNGLHVSDPSIGTSIVLQQQGSIRENYQCLLNTAKNQKIKPRGYGCCHGVATDWLLRVHGYDESYIGWGAEDRDLEVRAGYDGLKTAWISDQTTMVHLPHAKSDAYYASNFVDKNMARYKHLVSLTSKEDKMNRIVANKGSSWGEV